MFDELQEQYKAVRAAPTLEERRKLARPFFAFLGEAESAMYTDARRCGEDPRRAHLRVTERTRLNVFTLRHALGWTHEEAAEHS